MTTDLPIVQVLGELCATLAVCDELVLEAAPGAGKTTRVPLALLNNAWLGQRKIIMLAPRRMAARAAAQRMADLLGEPVGKSVGYRVRLEQKVSSETRIEVITEGILTRKLQSDPALAGVGVLIFDEFHERSLDADLGLALALQGRELFRTPHDPLKILVMSATLDGVAVAALLGDAPVLRCEGRQYPVNVHYGAARRIGQSIIEPVVEWLRTLLLDPGNGSILVFLPGQGEIRRVMHAVAAPDDVELLPLHGGLSLAQQQRAIEPCAAGLRKVVLATNIAETSLTIAGIHTVLDSGMAREPVYDAGAGMTRLQLRPISRSSSRQRKGRAGRLGPGRCCRLWSEQQQRLLAPHSTAEILQADLTPLALQLLAWGVADPAELAWLDAPPGGPYRKALALLENFGAARQASGGSWSLSQRGQQMALLPVHPRLAYMLLVGHERGIGTLACRLAAMLSERDPGAAAGADIERRLLLVSGDQVCPGARRAWLQRVKRQASSYARLCRNVALERDRTAEKDNSGIDPGDACGFLLACAFPDRLARQRSGEMGSYQLSNGRIALLPADDDLCSREWLAIAELGGQVGRAQDRIYLAATLNPDLFTTALSSLVKHREVVEWDDGCERFVAEQRGYLGELVLSRAPLQRVSAAARREAALALLARRGLQLLPWNDDLRQWQARVMLLRELEGGNGACPDVSDAGLLATLPHWLGPCLDDVHKLGDFRRLDLARMLRTLLPWPLPRELDERLPRHVAVPSGSTCRVDYTQSPPVLSVKLQEMFGSRESPALANGQVPLMLHLLSPAGRPLQVTQDLAGFWRHGYHEVKKEMRGRYPKHPWPDDPLKAAPTRHTKARRGRDR